MLQILNAKSYSVGKLAVTRFVYFYFQLSKHVKIVLIVKSLIIVEIATDIKDVRMRCFFQSSYLMHLKSSQMGSTFMFIQTAMCIS